MSGASLLANSIGYIGGENFNVIDILVTKNVVAVRDEVTNQAQSLFLGASKNVDIFAGEAMSLWMGSSNMINVYDSASNVSLNVSTNSTTTSLSGASKDLILTTDNNATYSIFVGDTEFSQSNDYQILNTTMSNGFYMDSPLLVDGHATVNNTLSVGGNIIGSSNIFAQNYNLFKYNTSNDRNAMLTGYAFTINSNDQLELLKYTGFSNGAKISKRVGLFGINKFNGAESSDTSYASFDVIGASGAGGNAMSINNNIVDYSGALTSNITLLEQSQSNIYSSFVTLSNDVEDIKSDINYLEGSLSNLQSTYVTFSNNIDGRVVTLSNYVNSMFNVSTSNQTSNIYFTTDSNLSSGAVGIGTLNPQYKLDVNGEIRATGDITAFSDKRIKKDFVMIENAMEKMRAIHGYTFAKIGNEERRFAGVIAQELQQIHPEVVSVDSNGMMSVAYGNMAGLFIQAFHELDQQIKEIKLQIGTVI